MKVSRFSTCTWQQAVSTSSRDTARWWSEDVRLFCCCFYLIIPFQIRSIRSSLLSSSLHTTRRFSCSPITTSTDTRQLRGQFEMWKRWNNQSLQWNHSFLHWLLESDAMDVSGRYHLRSLHCRIRGNVRNRIHASQWNAVYPDWNAIYWILNFSALVPQEIRDIYGIDLRDPNRGFTVIAVRVRFSSWISCWLSLVTQ